MPPDHPGRRERCLGVPLELVQQRLHHPVKALLVLRRVDDQLLVVLLPRRQHRGPWQTGGIPGERTRHDRQRRPGLGPERALRVDRALGSGDDEHGQLVGRDRLGRSSAVDAAHQVARVGDRRRRRERALDERAAGVLVLDREYRRLGVLPTGPPQQRDEQLGAGALDPHDLVDGECPDSDRAGRDDPLVGERSAPACARAASGSAATTASAANTPAASGSRRASIAARTADATSSGISGCSSASTSMAARCSSSAGSSSGAASSSMATAERRPAMIYPSGSGGSPTRPTAHRAT